MVGEPFVYVLVYMKWSEQSNYCKSFIYFKQKLNAQVVYLNIHKDSFLISNVLRGGTKIAWQTLSLDVVHPFHSL